MGNEEESRADEFSGHDRRRLAKAMSTATELRLFQRAQAVLRVAEGYSVAEVAYLAGVDRSSVHRWGQRYWAAHKVQDLADGSRSGRPRTAPVLTEELLNQVRARDPGLDGYQATTGTVP